MNISLPLSNNADLSEFVNSLAKENVTEWIEAVTVSMKTSKFLQFLARLFELRGFDMCLTEMLFLLNTVMDCVCNNDMPLEELCVNLLGKHGSLHDISLALRIVSKARGKCEKLMTLAEKVTTIRDKRLQSLFGSKLHELDWTQYQDKMDLLINMLSHAENSFAQLEDRPLREWIDIAECQKWDSYEPLNAEYGTAGYFFIVLESTHQHRGLWLQAVVDTLKKTGCFLYEKMISRLTFLIYHNELALTPTVQDSVLEILKVASKLVEHLREKKRSGIWMVSEERLQQQWIKRLKGYPSWNKVFPQYERSLSDLINLTTNPQDSKEETKDRNEKMNKIAKMIETSHDQCMKVLERIDGVLFKTRNIRLRNTQKLAVLSAYNHPKNLLCQVNTGEGKSYIIAALAILKIQLHGGSVDIITSSSVLAQRDTKNMKDIYAAFDIQVEHNCEEITDERKRAYACEVVYGDIAHFQRDFLLHNFYKRNILGGRQKDCVIVDEVDSMLLDNGGNMLYLSHNIPGLELLISLFVFIYKKVQSQDNDNSGPLSENVRKAVLVDLFGMVTKHDISQLLLHEGEAGKIATVWRHLIKNNIVDSEGVVQSERTEENLVTLETELKLSCGIHLTRRIMGMLTIVHNRNKEICVPSYLHSFVLQHLNEFVDSTLKGVFMQQNDEYVVDIDRTGRSVDIHPVIVIIDKHTGTDLSSSQWNQGLHQILQLKHGCRLAPINVKAVFVSNVSHLINYKNLYGFSGTLGSKVESDSLRDLYQADVMRIPTCKPKEFNENVPVLVREEASWIQALYDGIYNQFDADRSVLLVCRSINDVGEIYKRLCEFAENSVMQDSFKDATLYQRDFDEFDFDTNGGLRCRKLIISTNLAGRGTDIKLHHELIDSGGLHVIISFIPENSRIEDQAYGRAARCGQPGSGQIIAFIDKHASGANNIFQLKQFRDNAEVHRLRSLTNFYNYYIDVEERCLQMFQNHCSGTVASLYGEPEDELPSKNQVLYFALLDEWATWLDNEGDRIRQCEKNASDTEKQAIFSSAEMFLSSHPIPPEWDGNLDKVKWLQRPQPLLTLAQIMMKENNNDSALQLLQRISHQFVEFSAEAYYYMAVIFQRQIRGHKKFARETEDEVQEEDEEGFWRLIDNQWQWFGDKRQRAAKKIGHGIKWAQHKLHDGAHWTGNQFQKINDIKNSPELFVEVNEENVSKATTLFVRARAMFMKRIKDKRRIHSVVTALEQPHANSGGFAKQQVESIAVLEAFIGNIDNVLGRVPKPFDVLMDDEDEHTYFTLMKALRQAGIVSPTVLMDSIDDEMLQLVANNNCLPIQLLRHFIDNVVQNENGTVFENQKVVEKEMLTFLPLPSATGFLKSMQRAGCLLHERFYVAVKKTAKHNPLDKYTPVILQLDPFDLRLSENNLDEYYFYNVIDLENFADNYSENLTLHNLVECELAYIEIIATLNPLVITATPKMEQFDFVNADILIEELGLEESEAKWILEKLVDANMLEEILVDVEGEHTWKETESPEKATVSTCCTTVFVESTRISLDIFPENMQDSLGTVFARHFSYGYALKALAASIQETLSGKNVQHRILLPLAPYADLFEDMVNAGILINGRITHNVKEIYQPDNPPIGYQKNYLPPVLYEKLSKMAPWIKVNNCEMQSCQEYMREKCVPASAEIGTALANGMRLVVQIKQPNLWRWFFGIFADFGSWVTSYAFSRIGTKTTTVTVFVPAAVGSMQYFVSLFKHNRKLFAKTNASYSEEFSVLIESHNVSLQRRVCEEKNNVVHQRLQAYAEIVIEQLRQYILSHSLLTLSEMLVDDFVDDFHQCAENSTLLVLLRQTITSFMMTQTRTALMNAMTLLQRERDGKLSFAVPKSLLDTVIAFATTLIIDVNKAIRLKHRHNKETLSQFDPYVISRSVIYNSLEDSSCINEALRSQAVTLGNTLCKEIHSILVTMIEEVMETNIQPLLNEMMDAWREETALPVGELCLDAKTTLKKSAEYSAERLSKVHTSDFMARDLHNIFIKLCFREQRPEVLCHIVRYNYPMSAHCARIVIEGVLALIEELQVSIGHFNLALKRNKQTIYWITARRDGLDESCFINLSLKEDCFYVTEKNRDETMAGYTGLFENLCDEVEEFATEFSLGSDIFRSRLEKAIKENRLHSAWEISDNWIANEKLLCSVPF